VRWFAGSLILLSLLALVVQPVHAPAQEIGTIIVYKETDGPDATFTFTGSPGPLPSTFQITTSGGGGAQIFDVPVGVSYTIAETGLPSGWSLQEIFVDARASKIIQGADSNLYKAYLRGRVKL